MAALGLACGRGDGTAAGGGPAAATASAARPESSGGSGASEEFAQRCASCHGEQGKGDGRYVDELAIAPPNFRDAKWQGSITDDQIENAIQHGGVSVGKSAAMPSFPDFVGQPERLVAMRDYIRSFAR